MEDLESVKQKFWNGHEERMKELNNVISEIDKKFSDPEDLHEKFQQKLKDVDEMLRKFRES